MNFRQDEEHQDILEMVHDFAVNEVKPLAAESTEQKNSQ